MAAGSRTPQVDLGARLEALGQTLGAREVEHREGLQRARSRIEQLRGRIEVALERFHRAAAKAGAPHLRVLLGEIRTDEKHLRAVEFDLRRGRYRAIVTAKSRGEVTLVGPFRVGKNEGPCRTFALESDAELSDALATFLESFLGEASTP